MAVASVVLGSLILYRAVADDAAFVAVLGGVFILIGIYRLNQVRRHLVPTKDTR